MTKLGLEILNLHCLKSYMIRNTFANFEIYTVCGTLAFLDSEVSETPGPAEGTQLWRGQ